MDWEQIGKWVAGSGGAAFLAWLGRSKLLRTGTQIGAFLAAHKNLQTCRSELLNQRESFERQRAALIQQNADLFQATQQLAQASQLVLSLRGDGRSQNSSPAPDASPSPSPSGPTKPVPPDPSA